MTPPEIKNYASKSLADLKALVAEPIGMLNYKDELRRYQKLLNDAFVMIREIAESLEALSTPPDKPST